MTKNLQIKDFHTKRFSCVPLVVPAEWFLSRGGVGGGVEATLSITEGTEKNAKSIKRGKKSAPSSSHCSDDSFGWEDSRKTAFLSRRRIRSPQAIDCSLTSSIFTSILCTRWPTSFVFLSSHTTLYFSFLRLELLKTVDWRQYLGLE